MRRILIALAFYSAFPAYGMRETMPNLNHEHRLDQRQARALGHDIHALLFDTQPLRYQLRFATLSRGVFHILAAYMPHGRVHLEKIPVSCYLNLYTVRIQIRCEDPKTRFEPYIGFSAPIRIRDGSIER